MLQQDHHSLFADCWRTFVTLYCDCTLIQVAYADLSPTITKSLLAIDFNHRIWSATLVQGKRRKVNNRGYFSSLIQSVGPFIYTVTKINIINHVESSQEIVEAQCLKNLKFLSKFELSLFDLDYLSRGYSFRFEKLCQDDKIKSI